MREIAEQSLEEEDEYDPLVPGVSYLVSFRRDLHEVVVLGAGLVAEAGVWSHARVGEINAPPARELRGESEGAVYPAVGVEHRLAHSFHHAVNWLPEKLCEGLQGAADTENGECELVVESEGGVVDQASLQMEQRLKIGEHWQHLPLSTDLKQVNCVQSFPLDIFTGFDLQLSEIYYWELLAVLRRYECYIHLPRTQ